MLIYYVTNKFVIHWKLNLKFTIRNLKIINICFETNCVCSQNLKLTTFIVLWFNALNRYISHYFNSPLLCSAYKSTKNRVLIKRALIWNSALQIQNLFVLAYPIVLLSFGEEFFFKLLNSIQFRLLKCCSWKFDFNTDRIKCINMIHFWGHAYFSEKFNRAQIISKNSD